MSLREREDKNTHIFCPACGYSECTPLINKTSFSLKGGGWYKDGYKSKEEK
jgi:predicted nucleic acid-binding Zn ribbon protein